MTVNAHPGQRFSRDTSDERVVGAAHHGRYCGSCPTHGRYLPVARASCASARLVLVPFGGWSQESGQAALKEKTTLQQCLVEGS